MASIADNVTRRLQSFQALSSTLSEQSLDPSAQPLPKINNELARFKVWSGNIGAHRSGHSSLEYRLRDASHLREEVINLLEDLNSSLNDGTFVCTIYLRFMILLCLFS